MPGRVLITRAIPEPGPSLVRGAADRVDANTEDRSLTADGLKLAVAGQDAVLCLLTDQIDASVLEAAEGCKIFANMAVGYNNIDVAEATRRGILVTNTPGVLTECTADLTWALILGVARRVAEGDVEMRAGRFPGWGPLYMLGGDVAGTTLGLIGPGRIAAAVARRATGFGMTVLYHGRRPGAELDGLGARSVPLDELLKTSDFVSLHVPLSAETRHLIDAQALSQMKPTSYLINTSRGPVVDEAALVVALRTGQIAGAGLDVYEDEPKMATGLADCPNTVLLPHLGSATIATRAAMSRIAGENLVAVLQGRRPPNLVNPELWPDSSRARPHSL
ncbi:MAG: lactate dehydrogenase-like oxidoreductase [Planctomycetota bacterium]|nr:lactate dehydrogenase-like oxidoreductase [Planctomycetota bacterium]